MKLVKAIEDFLIYCKFNKNLSNNTLKAYKIDFKQFEKYMGGDKHVEICSHVILKGYLRYLFENKKLKATSIKRRMAPLKTMFKWLELNEVITKNPFCKIDIRIKTPKRLPRGLTRSEIACLIGESTKGCGISQKDIYNNQISTLLTNKQFNKFTALVAIEILFTTGLRVEELVNINIHNIDLIERTIAIIGKGDRERRVFITDSDICGLLKSYLTARAYRKPETNIFLINSRNKSASTQHIRKLIRQEGERANLKQRITPHMIRHTTATHLLEEGVDIRFVQRLLGHQSIATTQIYTHVSDSSLKSVICKCHPRKNILRRKYG